MVSGRDNLFFFLKLPDPFKEQPILKKPSSTYKTPCLCTLFAVEYIRHIKGTQYIFTDMRITWDEQKNVWLRNQRNISFEVICEKIENGDIP